MILYMKNDSGEKLINDLKAMHEKANENAPMADVVVGPIPSSWNKEKKHKKAR